MTNCNTCNLKDVQQYEEPIPEQEEEKQIPFWFENPNVILHSKYIYEIYPNEDMTYNQMLNAVTRSVLLLASIIITIKQTKDLQKLLEII